MVMTERKIMAESHASQIMVPIQKWVASDSKWVVKSWNGRLGRGPSSWVAASARRSRTERVVQFLGVQIQGHIVKLQNKGDFSTHDSMTAFTSFVTFTVTMHL